MSIDGFHRVKCPCGYELGEFGPWDDHGTVDMLCPKCIRVNSIHSQVLWFSEDHLQSDEKGKFILAEVVSDRQ